MNNLSLLTYTHSKCLDLHEVYFDRIKKFFPGLQHNYVTCNTYVPYANCLIYDDASKHSHQMIAAIDALPTEYMIYSQEDYILFDYVKEDRIIELLKVLESDERVSYIRLIQSAVGDNNFEYNDELNYVGRNNPYFYSTQISLWRKSHLRNMFELSNVDSIFQEPLNSHFLESMNTIGLYIKSRGKKVGGHYNSDIYPYTATAKVKGEWNTAEYPEEIEAILKEYAYLKK